MKKSIKRFLFIPVFLMVFLSISQTEDYKIWEDNFNLGYQYFNSNQFTLSETHFGKALEASKTAFIENAEEPITTLYFYANCKYMLSKYNDALKLFEEVLNKAKNLPQRNVDFEIRVWGEISSIYSSKGNTIKAISEQVELNNFIEEQKGIKSEIYATNVNNLGQMYFALGDCNTATIHYNKAKEIFQNINLRTINVAIVYNNLGLCYFGAGEYAMANETYLEAFAIVEELDQLGTNFYSKLISNIAALGQVEGDYENAKLLHEQSLSILLNLNLGDTIEYAEGLFVYGSLLKDLGKYDEALNEINNAKKIYDKYLEADHIKYADIFALLAELNLINGQTKEALKYYEQAAQLYKEKTPESNPGYGYALNGLGNTYQVLGDFEKALQYYLEAQKYLKVSLSESHKDFGITIMNIATVKANLG
ncbi:MAG: tetratricopeptide repeat protein, partial [Flavobacteriaceae bacterium]|nr:tetratricopeptide repeat protein [Flavobacteriaceae bacterium]